MANEPMPMNVNVYRHYKGGLYRMLFGATFSFATSGTTHLGAAILDGAACVVYCSLTSGHVFVRPYSEFFGQVRTRTADDGETQISQRFEPVMATGENTTNG